MADYLVQLKRTLTFSGSVRVKAKDEDAAVAKAEALVGTGKLGDLVDNPFKGGNLEDGWSIDDDETVAESAEED
jgi:hypothetical protein